MSIFSSIVTALPATIIWILLSVIAGSDYYWEVYFIAGGIYLVASLALGFIIPYLAPRLWKRHSILWLSGQEVLAWMVAILALTVLNLTPLCIGQDNGDGINDLTLCMLQPAMVAMVYSPFGFVLICLTALPGGWLINHYRKNLAT